MTLQSLLGVTGQKMKLVCTLEIFWGLRIQPGLRVRVAKVKSPMGSCQWPLHPGCAENMWLQGLGGSVAGLQVEVQIFQCQPRLDNLGRRLGPRSSGGS